MNTKHSSAPVSTLAATLHFEDNALLHDLFGAQAERLKRIATLYQVRLDHRGNAVACYGSKAACARAHAHLESLYARLLRQEPLADADFSHLGSSLSPSSFDLPKGKLYPRNAKQVQFLQAMHENALVFALGPAGTGKTCLAVCFGVYLLKRGEVQRVVLSRPAVEAGERLGFLPGAMREKVDPYLRPIYDILHSALGKESTERYITRGEIEIAPLAFMRGRTLESAFVLLDEAQNTTPQQMKMFLTRLGENARMVITGDPGQTDLPAGERSGLRDAEQRLSGIASFVRFRTQDVVRPALVGDILRAYNEP